ncbi:EfeM/EfeO family lipoprotein [Fodinicola acaciae]|uniref:EfeM/EfeO family lipoprotein n=1 Tax=Fodinicola acaciae TaxID=2681555 RepID=UPI001C9E575B|nr:EfeM/EfeO family lipoprotein [Fodinicola acaciae]
MSGLIASRRWWWPVYVIIAVAAFVAAFLVTRTLAPGPRQPDNTLTVARSGCGDGWNAPHAGDQVLYVHNLDDRSAEAYVVDAASGTVFAEVEALGPATTRPMHVSLPAGAYALKCVIEDTDPITGPTVRIGGAATGTSGIRPVTRADLVAPVRAYQRLVSAGIGTLIRDTTALRQAVASGDRASAQAAWLTAHLSYQRLGAAYDAFGDIDGPINGTTAGLPGGVTDAGFTGFHRIEYGLWHNAPPPSLQTFADKLLADTRTLQSQFADAQVDPRDLGLRTHEILEDASRDELTGHTDYGSDSMVATTEADLDGTRMVLGTLRPVLQGRYAGLPALDVSLNRLQTALDTGRGQPFGALPTARRQAISSALGDALERLAPIAVICDARRVS